MLWIDNQFNGVSVTNANHGNTNNFLKNVLVEVAVENYRQLMYEMVMISTQSRTEPFFFDPPLRANERILSGLVGNAIAKVASRSRCEARVDKEEIIANSEELDDGEYIDLDETQELQKTYGRVDYMAWYDNRTYAIELKMASMNCQTPSLTSTIKNRWKKVNQQAQTAQTHLRNLEKADKLRYPNPVSLALMVVVGRRKASEETINLFDESVGDMEQEFSSVLNGLSPKPKFSASYIFPEEFRKFLVRKKGRASSSSDGVIYTPFIGFIAREYVTRKYTKSTS